MGLVYRPRPILLGTDIETDEEVFLSPHWLETHLHSIGPTGRGKTRLNLWIFKELIQHPDAAVIVINPKGDFIQMARDEAIAAGEAERLILFDPADKDHVVGWNPLRPNGLDVSVHAKAARAAIGAACGQDSFDHTPQLARFLFLALCAARELEMTLVEAMQILRAGSSVRAQVLARLRNVFVRESLEHFDSLRESRQEELAASTLARLEAFVMDETIRNIVTQQEHALDIGEVIQKGEILLINLEENKPLRPDDVKLLGRLIVNDVVSHVFARTGKRNPVFMIIDECHTFATQDLCLVLDKGRELGLHCVLAHQFPKQLLREDPNGLLYGSVTENACTKIVFGGISYDNLESVAKDLFLCEFDPMRVKDEIHALEIEPVESLRAVPNIGLAADRTQSSSQSQSVAHAAMTGNSDTKGAADTTGLAIGQTAGTSLIGSDGQIIAILPDGTELQKGRQANRSSTDAQSETETSIWQHTDNWSRAIQKAVTDSVAEQSGIGEGSRRAFSLSVALTPFHELIKRYRVSSRTFWSFAEFILGCMQRLKGQPRGHFVLKTATGRPVFLRAPYVRDPFVSERVLNPALERIWSRPCYSTRLQIEQEEGRRRSALVRMPERRTIEVIPHAAKSVSYKRKKTPAEA